MPHYFFDTVCPTGDCHDAEGIALPNLEAVHSLARRALCEIARDSSNDGSVAFTVRVRDLTGAEIYRDLLSLSDHPTTRGASLHMDRSGHGPAV